MNSACRSLVRAMVCYRSNANNQSCRVQAQLLTCWYTGLGCDQVVGQCSINRSINRQASRITCLYADPRSLCVRLLVWHDQNSTLRETVSCAMCQIAPALQHNNPSWVALYSVLHVLWTSIQLVVPGQCPAGFATHPKAPDTDTLQHVAMKIEASLWLKALPVNLQRPDHHPYQELAL